MIFINPIEVLELQHSEIENLDNSLIKRAKRKLFADIDLSENGYIDYKGTKLTKSDCERAFDELENDDKKEFYGHLVHNKLLNDFLANGSEEIFSNFQQEGIYKLKDFIAFVSPYFVEKFDQKLVKSFKKNDFDLMSSILRTQFLIDPTHITQAFKSLSNEIQHRITELNRITEEIKNEESEYTDSNIEEVLSIVQNYFPVDGLNLLPSYFQSQLNKIASAINSLQFSIWNQYSTTSISLKLLEHILQLNTESIGKPVFQNNYEIVKKKHAERIEQEKNAPVLNKWARLLLQIKANIESVENNKVTANEACDLIKTIIDTDELNKLPSFSDEIREQIGYSIRSLSISCWNKQSDIKSSLALIDFALQIGVSTSAIAKFKQDKTDLQQIEQKYKGVLICYFCDNNPPDDKSQLVKTIYKETYRSYLPRRVQFTYSEISLPRCKNCKEIHSKGNSKFTMILIGCIVLGIVIGNAIDEHFIWGGLIGTLIGYFGGSMIESNQVSQNGIKEASETSISRHPLLIDRIQAGWTFSKPSA